MGFRKTRFSAAPSSSLRLLRHHLAKPPLGTLAMFFFMYKFVQAGFAPLFRFGWAAIRCGFA
jgi:hypothetical protein